jgi:hypothetical protein
MFSGQTLLVIGGLVLLTFAMLTFYTSEGNTTQMTIYNEALITATGMGQTVIEEMALKAFDENTIDQIVDSPDSLTLNGNLGPDVNPDQTTETFATFDDFDDFNGYTRTDSLVRLGDFDISVIVNYVKYEEPDSVVNVRTFYKKAEVKVVNEWLVDTLTLNYTASY